MPPTADASLEIRLRDWWEEPIDGTEASGARIGCECSECREARLRDDERMTYTARELAAAWSEGWVAGCRRRVP